MRSFGILVLLTFSVFAGGANAASLWMPLQGTAKSQSKGKQAGYVATTPLSLKLPKDGGTWPTIGTCKSAIRPNDSISLGSVLERGIFIRNAVVSPTARKAVVLMNSSAVSEPKNSPHTRIVQCD